MNKIPKRGLEIAEKALKRRKEKYQKIELNDLDTLYIENENKKIRITSNLSFLLFKSNSLNYALRELHKRGYFK